MKKFLFLSVMLGGVWLFSSSQVMAHAELLSSLPSAGEQLTESPSVIVLLFNEALATDSTLLLLGDDFTKIADLTATLNPDNAAQAIATLPLVLQSGTYTVQWTAVSQDGHSISGSFSFQIIASQEDGVSLIWFIVVVSIGAAVILYQGIRREVWLRKSHKE